MLVREKTTYSD